MSRERVHPLGTTATERKKVSINKLREAGGKDIHLSLRPLAYQNLHRVIARDGDKSETAAINRIIEEKD